MMINDFDTDESTEFILTFATERYDLLNDVESKLISMEKTVESSGDIE